MDKKHILKLHWKLFIPLIGLVWLIIGITIVYFVSHEKQRQKENLANRLLNVNNTVIDAYERGVDLEKTVGFIRLFTDNTTLAPLRITVYDSNGRMVADNPEATIAVFDDDGSVNPEYREFLEGGKTPGVRDVVMDDEKSMISSRISPDGKIYTFAALPYQGAVLDFLRIDPMVWIVVIALGLFSSALAYFGVRAVCGNVYTLQSFARAASADELPPDIDKMSFSKDELGEVSRNLLTLYLDKMHAQQEKLHHERQIGMNITHELNTPVGIIKGYLDTVINTPDMPDDMRNKFLSRAQQNVDRLTSIVNDVSMVMRLDEIEESLEVREIDFYNMMMQIIEDMAQTHMADNMAFELDIPRDCRVMGHESLLANAMLNLIYNAARHSGGSRMSLRWEGKDNGYDRFVFADDGVGVDEEHIDRLFDLFYRVDYGRTRKNGGSGLGLSLVRRIINAMGGEITVENNDGGGLKYTFTLPSAPV